MTLRATPRSRSGGSIAHEHWLDQRHGQGKGMQRKNTWIAANGDGFISQQNSGPLSRSKPLFVPCGLSCTDGLQNTHAFHQNPNADQAHVEGLCIKNYKELLLIFRSK